MVNPRVHVKKETLEAAKPMRLDMLGRIGSAMVVIGLGVASTYLVPDLGFARPWKATEPLPFWNVIGRPFEAEQLAAEAERAEEIEEVALEVLAAKDPEPVVAVEPREVVVAETVKTLPAYVSQEGDDKPVVQSLELFEGSELDRFFAGLARADAAIEGAVVRVVHWGDSSIGVDGIPGAIRRRMQNRFGDAGHGFHLMAPPNTSYRHREVDFQHNERWKKCFIIHKCRSDGHYGIGGTTFSSWGGAQSVFAPHETRSSGKVSRFDVFYAAQPEGGKFQVQVDDAPPVIIETAADALEDRLHRVDVPDGPHSLKVRAIGEGQVRMYGVSMERPGPGVAWDSAALVGAFTNRMNELESQHLSDQLRYRQTDLIVFTFGGNDMTRRIKMSKYADEYQTVIRHVRAAKPDAACVVMAPLDHGEREGANIVSLPVVPRMVAAQRTAAEAEGCAFFDTHAAMGGNGSAGRWFKRSPRLMSSDLGHATMKGHQVIGELFYRAMLEGYVAYRGRADAQGIPAAAQPSAYPPPSRASASVAAEPGEPPAEAPGGDGAPAAEAPVAPAASVVPSPEATPAEPQPAVDPEPDDAPRVLPGLDDPKEPTP